MSTALSVLDRPATWPPIRTAVSLPVAGTWPPIGAAARPGVPAERRVPASILRVRQLRRERRRRRFAVGIMVVGLAGAVVSGAVSYRAAGPHGDRAGGDPRVSRVYDPATGKLTMVAFAGDGSLRIDHWCYMDGERLIRMDVDENRDGVVDRREYYDVGERLDRTEYLKDGRVIRIELPVWRPPDAAGTSDGQASKPAGGSQGTETIR